MKILGTAYLGSNFTKFYKCFIKKGVYTPPLLPHFLHLKSVKNRISLMRSKPNK